MTRQVSLATRAFFFAAIPMALTLIVSFIFVSKAIEGKIKGRLRASLQKTEAMAARREAEENQRTLRALSALTENSSLKAGIGLLRETRDAALQEQVHETLARQLAQFAETLDCDLLLLEDPFAQPVAAVAGAQRARLTLGSNSIEDVAPSLIRVGGKLYEVAAVPINLEQENLGSLVVGKEFTITHWSQFGNAALIQDGRILLATFPAEWSKEIEQQLQTKCGDISKECEVQIHHETLLALPVHQEGFQGGVRLVSLQSIDAATREFTDSLASVFPLIGGGGVLLVLLFSAVGARSIAKPLVTLISQLRQEHSANGFPVDLKSDYQAAEVNELARQFSRAAGAIRESERRLDEATEQFIESMAQAQDARDPYTAGHSERVSAYATAIARIMSLQPAQVEIIRIGAKLHDIGKIGIPDAILRKPGKLTREEYMLIQRHPEIGKEILEKVGRFKDFLPIVELHHENPDGSGYPYRLREDEIPLGVRIVHVADVWDAITTDRAYRRAMSDAQARDLIRQGTGPLFDPDVVQALWTVLEEEGRTYGGPGVAQPHENDLAFYPLTLGAPGGR